MKLFDWMHNKLNGSKAKNKPNSSSSTRFVADEPSKDEFSDWPSALLAIGTLGSNNFKDDSERIIAEDSSYSCSQDCIQELTSHEQEEGDFQNVLKMCLREESSADHTNNCSNCEKKETLFPNSSLIPCRGNDLCLDNNKRAIGNKSLTFLLKKMFVCRSGLQRTPSFKDLLSTESTREKAKPILRAILNKKIYPQGSSSTKIIKKYLKDKQMAKSDNDVDEFNTAPKDGNKWVKTDSEYIVLEI